MNDTAAGVPHPDPPNLKIVSMPLEKGNIVAPHGPFSGPRDFTHLAGSCRVPELCFCSRYVLCMYLSIFLAYGTTQYAY